MNEGNITSATIWITEVFPWREHTRSRDLVKDQEKNNAATLERDPDATGDDWGLEFEID